MRNIIVILAAMAVAVSNATAQHTAGADDRSVKLRKQPGNVSYDFELTRGVTHAIVQPNFQFQSGDRFTLRVRVMTDSYVYVLNRTLVGSPDELRSNRQIRLVPDPAADPGPTPGTQAAPGRVPPAYSLVYPQSGDRLLKPGVVNLIPGSQMALEMDENPGVEQLVLVVSPRPLNIATMFNRTTGELKAPPKTGSSGQLDSISDVYTKLTRDLAEMARNAEVEEPAAPTRSWTLVPSEPAPGPPPGPDPKKGDNTSDLKKEPKPGPKPAPSCVAAPKAPKQPFLVEIVLAHYPA